MLTLVESQAAALGDTPPSVSSRCTYATWASLTVAAAAFPLLALLGVRRASDPVHPVATGAALGTACGASAGVMVEMWCPVATPQHIAIGHVLPIVALALVGALLGGQILRVRR